MDLRDFASAAHSPRALLLGALAFGVSACGSVPEGGPPPNPIFESLRPPAPPAADNFEARLAALGVRYRRVVDEANAQGCTVHNGVEVTALGDVTLTQPALLTADMAERFAIWVRDTAQPQAQRSLGTQLAAVDVSGSYSCRTVYGRRYAKRVAGRLSEHAHANAIDIVGFKFANGQEAQFVKHWRGARGASEFLQSTSAGACATFATTLTPDYDRFHRDHIHLDASQNKEANFCGIRGRFSPGAVPAFARYKAPGKKKIVRARRKKV
jgi:hypothetical protein